VSQPSETLDLNLASALAAAFWAGVRGFLKPEELQFLDGLSLPRVSAERDDDGDLVLVLNYYGNTTTIGWDGSPEDATEIVSGLCETAAYSISEGYWSSGGWRGRTT
jgi:hypothetical protein